MNLSDFIKTTKDMSERPSPFRLARVTSVDANGRAKVTFYGETEESSKSYPYIATYSATENDVVLMAAQGNTFVIIGKVNS